MDTGLMTNRNVKSLRSIASREERVLRRELRALRRVFVPTVHNHWSKSIGTILLFSVWAIVYVGIGVGFLEQQPPFFLEYTILVFAIIARWWGVESVWESISNIDRQAMLMAIEEMESEDERAEAPESATSTDPDD